MHRTRSAKAITASVILSFVILSLMILVAALPAAAQTGIPDLSHSTYWWDYQGSGPLTLLAAPDGGGASFDQAADPLGNPADATLHLQVVDSMLWPVANFPREDLWLEWADAGVRVCAGGSIADANTDGDGQTYWRNPLLAGGSSAAGCIVMLNGMAASVQPPLPLQVNSADMNGDLLVNLADVSEFVGFFYGPYDLRADLHCDGIVNLSDVTILIQALGAGCP